MLLRKLTQRWEIALSFSKVAWIPHQKQLIPRENAVFLKHKKYPHRTTLVERERERGKQP